MKISLTLLFLCLAQKSISQTVCSLSELIKEIHEDINDNGRLDCLRENYPPIGIPETEEAKEKRRAALWVGDCAFEAVNEGDSDWLKQIQDNYGLVKGLVDVQGNTVDKDFDYQADMCEIIRAFVANHKFPLPIDLGNIPSEITDHIKCAGKTGQSEICAVTAHPYPNEQGWLILLKGQTMTFNGNPKWKVAPEVKPEGEGGEEGGTAIAKF